MRTKHYSLPRRAANNLEAELEEVLVVGALEVQRTVVAMTHASNRVLSVGWVQVASRRNGRLRGVRRRACASGTVFESSVRNELRITRASQQVLGAVKDIMQHTWREGPSYSCCT